MQPILEDLYFGPLATPSLSPELPFRWEDSQRRVRVIFAGLVIADSKRVMRLQEYGRLPVYYFPHSDIRQEVLEVSDHKTHSSLKGEASYWTIRVGDRVAEDVAWSYFSPPQTAPQVKGYIAFYWHLMDSWYEEDEQVYGHARDPYKRVDILPSSRHVRVVLGGETIADTCHPQLLLETGGPTRYYLPEQDIHMEWLQTSETTTRCPYKGQASYWSANIGRNVFKDIVWSYREPLPTCSPIAGFLSLFNERVDAIYVDDELVLKPITPWSEGGN
jgi:uncharacterized protein (DUF427 family)